MAVTIPADSHVPGDTGHVTDHNNISDVLTSLTAQTTAITPGKVYALALKYAAP